MYNIESMITIAKNLEGAKERGIEHQDMLNFYLENLKGNYPRGYKPKITDSWCMLFISYLMLASSGVKDLCEVSVQEFVNKATDHVCSDSYYVEKIIDCIQSYTLQAINLKVGDIVCYWNVAQQRHTHVDIVTDIHNSIFTTIGGNESDSVRKDEHFTLNNVTIVRLNPNIVEHVETQPTQPNPSFSPEEIYAMCNTYTAEEIVKLVNLLLNDII